MTTQNKIIIINVRVSIRKSNKRKKLRFNDLSS